MPKNILKNQKKSFTRQIFKSEKTLKMTKNGRFLTLEGQILTLSSQIFVNHF